MNEKLTKIKNRAKAGIKEYAPVIVTGASALALVAYAVYSSNKNPGTPVSLIAVDPEVEIMESDNGEGFAVLSSLEALLMMEGNSKTRYKLGEDTYSFVRNENPTD